MSANVYNTFEYSAPRYFGPMLNDNQRNQTFQNAISTIIQEFTIAQGRAPRVLDVGAGTGLLSIYAAQGGAEFVVGIEANEERAKICRKNVAKHGLQNVIGVCNCISTDFTLETCGAQGPFDILVCELMGTMVHYEQMNKFISDLYDRRGVQTFLQANGKKKHYCVPQHVEMWVQGYNYKKEDEDSGAELFFEHSRQITYSTEFQQFDKFGIIPSLSCFSTVVNQNCVLIDQPTFTKLHLKQVLFRNDSQYLFVEWKCRLWKDIWLENSIPNVSALPSNNFYARLMAWGFEVCIPPPSSTSLLFLLTKDGIDVKEGEKREKRKREGEEVKKEGGIKGKKEMVGDAVQGITRKRRVQRSRNK